MGNGLQKEEKEEERKFKNFYDIVDYIATNYILTMNFKNMQQLSDKEYCDKLVVLTADIFAKYFNNVEITYLAQRIKDGEEVNELKTEPLQFMNRDALDAMDISNDYQKSIRKKRVCIGIAKFYVKIAHIFAAIVMTINPVYSYKDDQGNTVKTPLLEKDKIPKGVDRKIFKLNICDNRIRALKHGQHVDDASGNATVQPRVCDLTEEGDTLEDEPGIPELMRLYLDDNYDYSTGEFKGMSEATEKQFKRDLRLFWTAFTGEDTMPDHIKSFGDIKLRNYRRKPVCKDFIEEEPDSVKVELNPLFQEPPLTEENMMPPMPIVEENKMHEPIPQMNAEENMMPPIPQPNAEENKMQQMPPIPQMNMPPITEEPMPQMNMPQIVVQNKIQMPQQPPMQPIEPIPQILPQQIPQQPPMQPIPQMPQQPIPQMPTQPIPQMPPQPIPQIPEIKGGKGGKGTSAAYTMDAKDELYVKYAQNIVDMVQKASDNQRRLLSVINEIFTFVIDPFTKKRVIRIHPKLTDKSLQRLVEKTRKLIIALYISCEQDYLTGVKIFEAIVETKIMDTTKRQIENLTRDADQIVRDFRDYKPALEPQIVEEIKPPTELQMAEEMKPPVEEIKPQEPPIANEMKPPIAEEMKPPTELQEMKPPPEPQMPQLPPLNI